MIVLAILLYSMGYCTGLHTGMVFLLENFMFARVIFKKSYVL